MARPRDQTLNKEKDGNWTSVQQVAKKQVEFLLYIKRQQRTIFLLK